ncbi:polyphosphate kinase 2 [cf. Phormidesmis sp. LEGE 11477]|uniref:polyphosphate kinase 2 n=1 Tax=cf. Phormidesmis sp. LEGE 11477 TaxID=1828680 RepID=UPI00187F9158|nr:polyphosphate kinase 2 [cf. Phormidesmis sp. LEGE 11477]MBE9061423.1 polyphosphate kinase 2 [cf. Phormidesmis sp. LEGE 11477]
MAKKKSTSVPEIADTNSSKTTAEKKAIAKTAKTQLVVADEEVSRKAKGKKDKASKKKKATDSKKLKKLNKKVYKKELERLQTELVKLQYWVKEKGLKVVVLFEGRDAAGKGGAIKRISECMNPRICRVVALGTPTEKEKTQWYFQRYVAQLPSAGEIVLFDRSWYNRAGVERVMGFCTHQEYVEFLRSCPEFEHMLQRAGIVLVKYWFSVSDAEQEKRFQARLNNPIKRWKLSPMDLEARARWVEYSKAKDDMFGATDTTRSPWNVVEADDKKRARLNCISHLLNQIAYEDLTPPPLELPKRQKNMDYERPPMDTQNFVPDQFS